MYPTIFQSTQPPPCAFTPTTRLQALSIVTLAKMCIQHEDMAKKIVPAFGHLLDTSDNIAIKNNIMFALSDMCVRYASLVDPLLPQVRRRVQIKKSYLKVFAKLSHSTSLDAAGIFWI
jgi:hypothetical protein